MAKWHVKDGQEFEDSDEEITVEEEGYLHGKKVLEDLDEDGEEASGAAAPAGVCPFSGMARGMEGLKVSDEPAKVPAANGAEVQQE